MSEELKPCPFCGMYPPPNFVSTNKDLVRGVQHILKELWHHTVICDWRFDDDKSKEH